MKAQEPAPHAFIDRENVILQSVAIGLMTADLTQTRIRLDSGLWHEDNPLARPFL